MCLLLLGYYIPSVKPLTSYTCKLTETQAASLQKYLEDDLVIQLDRDLKQARAKAVESDKAAAKAVEAARAAKEAEAKQPAGDNNSAKPTTN